jgi:DNA replication protein DnaC
MNPAQLERLAEHLQKLRLFKSRERLEALLQEAAGKEMAYSDFLEQVLSEEVAAKTSKNVTMRTSMARFPFVKPLETFDFGYQPSIDRKQVQMLASCHYIEHGDNVLVLGPPGVGKTHLAVALGLKAIEAGYRVLFSTAAHLIATLTKAHAEGRLDEKLKLYTTPRLLIIDEIGYLPGSQAGFICRANATRSSCAACSLRPRASSSTTRSGGSLSRRAACSSRSRSRAGIGGPGGATSVWTSVCTVKGYSFPSVERNRLSPFHGANRGSNPLGDAN